MSEETFNFLITTDNHIGYKEDDHIRCKDSYKAFEEALQIARDRRVDFVLLGGDLFHKNRPSPDIEHKCIKIIRRHMTSNQHDKTSFERVAGSFSHSSKISHANFEDSNLIVPCPILTIHGNHDDRTGPNSQSVCEKLATCGLLNYFGAITTKSSSIIVEPIILKKGKIKLALYGMGFIPDHKLRTSFDKGEVSFTKPPKDTFNILVVHQTRYPYVKMKYIPDELFPKFFHLIIRGHEHSTQKPEPIPDSKVEGLAYQPGSTVATSISGMEAGPKKVGLFQVKLSASTTKTYDMEYELISLKSCRRMILKDITQKELMKYIKKETGSAKIPIGEFRVFSKNYVEKCIEELLDEDSKLFQNDSKDDKYMKAFCLPIMRLRLEYTMSKEKFDELEVWTKYYPSRVANKDIVLFKKQKLAKTDDGEVIVETFNTDDNDEDMDDIEYVDLVEQKRDSIDIMIENYFKDKPPAMRLQALSLEEYTNAVKGAAADGNVISKVLSAKKKEILARYKSAITSEKVAELEFGDEDSVMKWFQNAFDNNHENLGGDDPMEVIEIC